MGLGVACFVVTEQLCQELFLPCDLEAPSAGEWWSPELVLALRAEERGRGPSLAATQTEATSRTGGAGNVCGVCPTCLSDTRCPGHTVCCWPALVGLLASAGCPCSPGVLSLGGVTELGKGCGHPGVQILLGCRSSRGADPPGMQILPVPLSSSENAWLYRP